MLGIGMINYEHNKILWVYFISSDSHDMISFGYVVNSMRGFRDWIYYNTSFPSSPSHELYLASIRRGIPLLLVISITRPFYPNTLRITCQRSLRPRLNPNTHKLTFIKEEDTGAEKRLLVK